MSLKTQKNNASVAEFLDSIPEQKKREDSKKLHSLFQKITGDEGKMWGSTIIGYGMYKYKRVDGKEYDFMSTGFSPRKQSLTLYIMPGYGDLEDELEKLGKYKNGKSCLYVNKLEDIDMDVLSSIIKKGFDEIDGTFVDYKTGTRTKL